MIRLMTFIGLLACLAPVSGAEPGNDELLRHRLEAHITFLADDSLRGRQPGTPGYDIAANYVASQFRQLGLQSAGNNSSYFQNVPLRRSWLAEGSAALSLVRNGQQREFVFIEEFFMGPGKVHTESSIEAGMVFAGYGIDAPLLEHDDYAGLDVAGKIVVVLGGKPADFPSEEGAHFASGRELTLNAARRGAIGLISVHTPLVERRRAWARNRLIAGKPAMGWLDEKGEVHAGFGQVEVRASLHHEAAAALFEGAKFSMEELIALDEAGQPLPTFPLQGRVRMGRENRHEEIFSPNVAAILPGEDPLLSSEFVVYTAHLDHLGELHGEGHGDGINNGALDNASGISVMLETARLFRNGPPPRRSILFLAVTAEEKGLVGSEYFAHNPTVPMENIAGLVNLDMPLLLYDFGDVIAFGAQHSTIGDAVQQAADEAGVALTPDPFPEQSIFVRSDHYRFVQQGVPAVFLVTGMKSADGVTDTRSIFEGFLRDHYHRPSDDLGLAIDYRAAARFTRINRRIGEILANDPNRPRWHEGDFFGETFGR